MCEERLARLTLADDAADDRGPCDEAFANRLMAAGGCPGPLERPDVKCPCQDGTTRCTAGATLELESATAEGLPVLVVADDEPLLQALRDELRPGIADVDGLLGASLLGALVVDVDYPRARVILRCADPPPPGVSCRTSPHLAFQDEELDHPACLPDAAPLPPPP